MKQLNDIELDPFYIDDEEYREFQLRALLKPDEVIIPEHLLNRLTDDLEDLLYKIKYLDRTVDTASLLDQIITDLNFIKLGARP